MGNTHPNTVPLTLLGMPSSAGDHIHSFVSRQQYKQLAHDINRRIERNFIASSFSRIALAFLLICAVFLILAVAVDPLFILAAVAILFIAYASASSYQSKVIASIVVPVLSQANETLRGEHVSIFLFNHNPYDHLDVHGNKRGGHTLLFAKDNIIPPFPWHSSLSAGAATDTSSSSGRVEGRGGTVRSPQRLEESYFPQLRPEISLIDGQIAIPRPDNARAHDFDLPIDIIGSESDLDLPRHPTKSNKPPGSSRKKTTANTNTNSSIATTPPAQVDEARLETQRLLSPRSELP